MVMKAYTRTLVGTATVTERDGSMQYVNGKTINKTVLANISSRVGDYSSPNPHQYTKNILVTLRGYEKSLFANGESRVVTGPDLRIVSYSGFIPDSFDENIRQMALAKLYDRLRASDIDLSVDGVQWRQTLAMLNLWKRTISGIAKSATHLVPKAEKTQRALDRLNKGNLHRDALARRTKTIDKSLDWLASKRLEYVYGWKPTLNTFYDLAKLATTPDPSRSFLQIEASASIPSNHVEWGSINTIPARYEVFKKEFFTYVCEFAPADNVMTKLGQISSLNPVSLIYEATPYSFVLDWAVGIGSWLRSMESALMYQSTFRKGYTSQGRKVFIDTQWRGANSTGTYQVNATGSYTFTTFRRSVLGSLPFPTKPVVRLNFGIDQALNAAALVKQKTSFVDRLLAIRK